MRAYENITLYTFTDGTQLVEEAGSLPTPSSSDVMVKAGKEETLQDICFDQYGTHEEWVTIAFANGVIDPWQDLTNITLIIPSLN